MWPTNKRSRCPGLLLLTSCLGCVTERPEVPQAPPASQSSEEVTGAQTEWAQQLATALHAEDPSIRVTSQPVTINQLRQLDQLESPLLELQLDAGFSDDACVDFIAGLDGLEHLRIRKTALQDADLERLASGSLQSLRILNLPQAKITWRGIRQLAHFPQLMQLRLGGPQLDDRAVGEMAGLPGLRALHLIGPSLTGKALDELATAPKLASLYLDDCPLPDAAWERLFAAKPNLHVHIDQAHHDRDPNPHSHD